MLNPKEIFLENGKIDNKEAFAIAKIANVIIQSAKSQIDYKKITGNPDKITFLESN
jgi:hypothetical protein